MKKSNGITLISLIITIMIMIIIASATVTTSLDRFEINNLNKMISDIELLDNKVLNYYSIYNSLPVIRDSNNNIVEYTYTSLEFDKNLNDNEKYYIINLELMNNIALNYGKEGFENRNLSDDVYIINEKSHQIYYVKGIELNEKYYHSILEHNYTNDNIPPTTPQINVISGTEIENGIYSTNVELEIIPGKDNWSGISDTTYSIKNGPTDISIKELENNILLLTGEGKYEITVKTYDNSEKKNCSEASITIEISIPIQYD